MDRLKVLLIAVLGSGTLLGGLSGLWCEHLPPGSAFSRTLDDETPDTATAEIRDSTEEKVEHEDSSDVDADAFFAGTRATPSTAPSSFLTVQAGRVNQCRVHLRACFVRGPPTPA